MTSRALLVLPVALATLAVGGAAVATTARPNTGNPIAVPDSYRTAPGTALSVGGLGVLRNDRGGVDTVVSHSDPAHGTLTLSRHGSFSYTPDDGFVGTDTFRYTTTDAVHLYRTHLPPLANLGGVAITGGAYGSSLAPVPGTSDEYYGLTDRGPNVDGPDDTKVEPLPDFRPAIGQFLLANGAATLLRRIPLRAADGTAYNGQVNCAADTGETIIDLSGTVLPCTDTGYDPEGLVALPDGTFWVSDEYGPFITHFDHNGRQLERLSPFDHSVPRELANRVPNKGMEGLAVTPDGKMLVGIMQAALQQPDLTVKYSHVSPVRIVTVDLATHRMHEYLYLLTDPDRTSSAVSEITALSDTSFVVDERDGNFEPDAFKKLFRIDLRGATDVGPAANVPGASYDPGAGGLLVGEDRTSIEELVQDETGADAATTLAAAGIHPVSKRLDVDLGGLLTNLDPSGDFFGHDKVEGVAAVNGGSTLVVSNDNDFGIDALANDTPPFELEAKMLPDGTQDDGEYLAVDTTKLPATASTTTVTITVR